MLKYIVILITLLLVGCASDRYPGNAPMVHAKKESATETGVRYLLGRGVRQNDEKAFEYFLKGANQGNARAQNQVAYMYAAGKGTEQDYGKAIEYYQKAADQGLMSAQYNLGLMYLYGMGTPVNEALGLEWVQKAASKGFEPAKETLAKAKKA